MATYAYGPDGRKDETQAQVTESRVDVLNRLVLQVQGKVLNVEALYRRRLALTQFTLSVTIMNFLLIVFLMVKQA